MLPEFTLLHNSPGGEGGGETPIVWAIGDVPLFGGRFLIGTEIFDDDFLIRDESFGLDLLK